MKSYTIRASYRQDKTLKATFDADDNNSLDDIHRIIQDTFGFDDSLPWAFYMGKRLFDFANEYGCVEFDAEWLADQAYLSQFNLSKGRKLLYIYDFLDQHVFDLLVTEIGEANPELLYPWLVEKSVEPILLAVGRRATGRGRP